MTVCVLCLVHQVSGWHWGRYPFKAGDKILLSGTFTTGMVIALDRSFGNASLPIVIASMDPLRRATIAPTNGSAIFLRDSLNNTARGLGIVIRDLNLVGPGTLDSGGTHSWEN